MDEQKEAFPIKCNGCGFRFVAWNQVFRISEKHRNLAFCKPCLDKLHVMQEKAETNILRGFVKYPPED